LAALFAIVLSYLLGSIPTAAIAGRIKGVDLRTRGSGNLGATNALRVLGPAAGVPVLAIDVAKGAAAVFIPAIVPGVAEWLGPSGMGLTCGLAAIVGHSLSVFTGFRGGKGVATACGVFLAMAPLATVACLVLWIVLVLITRYVSVGSIAAAVFLPFAIDIEAAVRGKRPMTSLLIASAAVAIFVVVRHRPNIRRLVAGSESKFGTKKQGES